MFDPAGFTRTAKPADIKRWRESEIMHGRVAMLAALGFVVGEQLEDFPAFIVSGAGGRVVHGGAGLRSSAELAEDTSAQCTVRGPAQPPPHAVATAWLQLYAQAQRRGVARLTAPARPLPPPPRPPGAQNWDGDIEGPAIYQFQQAGPSLILFWAERAAAGSGAQPEGLARGPADAPALTPAAAPSRMLQVEEKRPLFWESLVLCIGLAESFRVAVGWATPTGNG